MIYIDNNIDGFDLDEALMAVSPQRREYALRYRQERDQRLCLAAYRLLQRALASEYGIFEAPVFAYTSQGKPLLEEHPDIHFSLSHCRMAVACALSDRPVGIDIETIDHYDEQVALTVMNEAEMDLIKSLPDHSLTFTRLWTMKESLFKLTGDDAHGDIRNMLAKCDNVHFNTTIHHNYLCTTCNFINNTDD